MNTTQGQNDAGGTLERTKRLTPRAMGGALRRRTAVAAGAFVIAASLAAAALQQSAIAAGPSVQEASVGGGLARDPATGGLCLSLGSACITVAPVPVLDGWIPGASITVGRQALKWGPGVSGSLLLSGCAPLDGIALAVEPGRLRYVQVAAARDVARGRWLLAHRIEGRAAPGMLVGISEAVAVSGGFRLRPFYLMPGCPYFLAQHLNMQDDRSQDWWSNVLAAVDASVALSNHVTVYGEFLADDFPWAASTRGRVPYMIGALAGIRFDEPPGLEPYRAVVEYVRINNYVYSHKNPDNTYVVSGGTLIGHPLGPDADALYLFVARPLNGGLFGGLCCSMEVTGRLGYERHGEGRPGHPWDPSEGVSHEFLSGVVETRKILGVTLEAVIGPGVQAAPGSARTTLRLATVLEDIDNAGHVASAKALEAGIRLSLRLAWAR